MYAYQPIGIFDSGYGGLTVMREIVKVLPEYDYVYLGDNARTPYGNRSFETVYHYTWQCVQYLFSRHCHLVILACNTASAKALRTIQQRHLPVTFPERRVLGVIRPTTEIAQQFTRNGAVGILATTGTVQSASYVIEIRKFFPALRVYQQACPMWVPLVENNEHEGPGADYFVKKYLDQLFQQAADLDALILACTHYPLLIPKIKAYLPDGVQLISQGPLVAASLKDYLRRHPEIDRHCSKSGRREFLTTDSAALFARQASIFYGEPVEAQQISVEGL
ncbi:MAG: glutamate racemase [Thermoflavifilum sp.]|nr:glutamate racemase [Thermoflavifilum sp.]